MLYWERDSLSSQPTSAPTVSAREGNQDEHEMAYRYSSPLNVSTPGMITDSTRCLLVYLVVIVAELDALPMSKVSA